MRSSIIFTLFATILSSLPPTQAINGLSDSVPPPACLVRQAFHSSSSTHCTSHPFIHCSFPSKFHNHTRTKKDKKKRVISLTHNPSHTKQYTCLQSLPTCTLCSPTTNTKIYTCIDSGCDPRGGISCTSLKGAFPPFFSQPQIN